MFEYLRLFIRVYTVGVIEQKQHTHFIKQLTSTIYDDILPMKLNE